MPLQVTHYVKSRTHLRNFITTVKYLFKRVFVLIFLCHANMRLNTTHVLYAYSVLPTAYVHPWRSQSTLRQWKNPGDALADIRHYYRCFAQTPAWTRCHLHEGPLLSGVWCRVQHHRTPQCFLEANNQQCQWKPTRKMTTRQTTWAPPRVQKFYLPCSWHVLPVSSYFLFFPLPHSLTKLSS